MSEELKPCWHCGSNKVGCDDDNGMILCDDCGNFVGNIDDTEELKLWWNTRPIEAALRAEVEQLKAERQWIPVSERLPDDCGEYLVLLLNKHIYFSRFDDGRFAIDISVITHWMPLPEPPETDAHS